MGMTYVLSTEERFHRQFMGLPREAQRQVIGSLIRLTADPYGNGQKLKGDGFGWRSRAGAYRLLYRIGPNWVHVHSVEHRSGVYKGGIARPRVLPAGPLVDAGSISEFEETGWVSVDESTVPENGNTDNGPPVFSDKQWEQALTWKTPEDLLNLVDFGLPAPVYDRLIATYDAEHSTEQDSHSWMLKLETREVLDAFWGRVLRMASSPRIRELTIVAPWITPWQGKRSSFAVTLRFITARAIRTRIITRPPDLDAHRNALKAMSDLQHVSVNILAGLHAKFYICDVPPAPVAMIASANATHQSLMNFEVGVLLRGVREAESLIGDLQSLTTDLIQSSKPWKE